MLGRAQQAANILQGAQPIAPMAHPVLKARLKRELVLLAGVDPWHRDGLLFESICWLIAGMQAGPDEVISDPHRKATQQGADTIKVAFDVGTRELRAATVYEYKCTNKARRKFKQEVLPAFSAYLSGARDDQLSQTTLALLSKYGLSEAEQIKVYEKLILDRPLKFQAALTVNPIAFPQQKSKKLFKDFDSLKVPSTSRVGDTFPVPDVRTWYDTFAADVWTWIDANV
jgi:hypothetical protein